MPMLGGFGPLLNTLRSRYPALQWRAAQALATIVQNNEKCQEWCLGCDVFSFLLPLLTFQTVPQPQSDEDKVIVKAILCVSGLVREFAKGEKEFLARKGFDALLKLLDNPQLSSNVKKKSLNVLRYLIKSNEMLQRQALQFGVISVVVPLLRSDDIDLREVALGVIVSLCEVREKKEKKQNNKKKKKKIAVVRGIDQLKTPQLHVRKILEDRFAALSSIADDQLLGEENELELLSRLCGLTFPDIIKKHGSIYLRLKTALDREQKQHKSKESRTNLYQPAARGSTSNNSSNAASNPPLLLSGPPSSSPSPSPSPSPPSSSP